MKCCPACGEIKQPEEFYPIKLKRKDGRIEPGLAPYCRQCSNARAAKYQKERYHADPEYRTKRDQQNYASEKRKRAADPEYAKAVIRRGNQRQLERKRAEVEAGQIQPKLCVDCAVDISGRHYNTKYCPDCKAERRQTTVRNYVARQRPPKQLGDSRQ